MTVPVPTEAQVLRAVMQRLERHPAVARAWRQNSGAGMLTRRSGAASQWIRFGFKGQPDVCGYLNDGRALFVEVKKPSGEVTPEQAEFLQSARSAGCVAFVARSVDDVDAGLGFVQAAKPAAECNSSGIQASGHAIEERMST